MVLNTNLKTKIVPRAVPVDNLSVDIYITVDISMKTGVSIYVNVFDHSFCQNVHNRIIDISNKRGSFILDRCS